MRSQRARRLACFNIEQLIHRSKINCKQTTMTEFSIEDYLPGRIIDDNDELNNLIEIVRAGHTPESGKVYAVKSKMTDAKIAFQKMIKAYRLLLAERNQLIEEKNQLIIKNQHTAITSYAEMASKGRPKQQEHVFFIEPEEEQDSATTLNTFKLLVKPAENKIKIKACRKKHNGLLEVRTNSEDDEQKIRQAYAHGNVNAEFKKPPEKLFRLTLKSIHVAIDKDEIAGQAYAQNEEKSLNGENFKILFERKPSDKGFRDVVVLTNGATRKQLIREGLYIGSQFVRATDFIRPTQCFKCHLVGHVARHCRTEASEIKCRSCGGSHSGKCETPVGNFALKHCINCEKFNKKVKQESQKRKIDHSPYDHCCLTLKAARDKERSELDELNKC